MIKTTFQIQFIASSELGISKVYADLGFHRSCAHNHVAMCIH